MDRRLGTSLICTGLSESQIPHDPSRKKRRAFKKKTYDVASYIYIYIYIRKMPGLCPEQQLDVKSNGGGMLDSSSSSKLNVKFNGDGNLDPSSSSHFNIKFNGGEK